MRASRSHLHGGGQEGRTAAPCGFPVRLCPLSPHVDVEVVKCHQLGGGAGAGSGKSQ